MNTGQFYKNIQKFVLIFGILISIGNIQVFGSNRANQFLHGTDNELTTDDLSLPFFLKNKKLNYSWGLRISPQGAFTSKEPFSLSYITEGKYRTD